MRLIHVNITTCDECYFTFYYYHHVLLDESYFKIAYHVLLPCAPPILCIDRTHVPDLHILMRCRLLGQMMPQRRHQSLFGVAFVDSPSSIVEISVR
jgi:hypothetical protein